MPPQARSGRGDSNRRRGGGRFRRAFRGRGFGRGGFETNVEEEHPNPAPAVVVPGPMFGPEGVTVGVRRPAVPGTLGQPLAVMTNHFKVTIPEATIHHYYVGIQSDKEMPVKWNHELIRHLQEHIAPNVFTPRAVYDGRNSLFTTRRLPLAGGLGAWNHRTFEVALEPAREGGRPPKMHRVHLSHVAEINPTLLKRYQEGQQPIGDMVLTTMNVMNVVIRMSPASRYPSNSGSFFTDKEVRPIGSGIELWRGYFQSVRLGVRSLLINMDISTGMMYAPGPMIGVCRQILNNDSPTALVPGQDFSDHERLRLQRFLTNVRFVTSHKNKNGQISNKPKVIKKISSQSADNYMFDGPGDKQMSVAQYFRSIGVSLQYPNYVCIETSTGAAFPIELCSILPGQLMRKQVPPEVIQSVLEFSTKKPDELLDSIFAGLQACQYGQSEYMRQFGVTVGEEPEKCAARVLPAPALTYGAQSKSNHIRPTNGSWNLQRQKLYEPADIGGAWAVVSYDARNAPQWETEKIVFTLRAQAELLGIQGMNADPPLLFPSAQSMDVENDLQMAGRKVFLKTRKPPTLFVVILPDDSCDIYRAVKHFGDVSRGVATQCINGYKSKMGTPQYWGNVCLKINAKLGGVNSILDPRAHQFISDRVHPVMIMGAGVMHPPPGARNRPSFASIVGSIDSDAVRYTAASAPQAPRTEIIDDVEDMVYKILGRHAWWKKNHEWKKINFPKRIVYYRDGVSESQFRRVLDEELPAIKVACQRLNINPTITVVVVGKRNHVRFFPTHGMGNRSGNCPAGTVVDDVVGHSTEFDFYLQSHASPLGTSRFAHYSVLYDENGFTADSMQSLSFALCHVYARTTRSVSIPAPIYYADIVCYRATNHFHPSTSFDWIDETEATASGHDGETSALEHYNDLWKPINKGMHYKMYFL